MWYLGQTMFHKCNIKVNSDRKPFHFHYQMCHKIFPKSSPTNELRLCIPQKSISTKPSHI